MIDWLWDIIVDFIQGFNPLPPVPPDDIVEIISTGLLIYGAISVASLTVDTIQNELSRRQELKSKGVTSAVITEFIMQNGHTEITLAALNAQNIQVGTVKMKAKSSCGIQKGIKINL